MASGLTSETQPAKDSGWAHSLKFVARFSANLPAGNRDAILEAVEA
jgi:hypothetical protein